MRIALHPAIVGWDPEIMGDYCRYLGVGELFYQLHDVAGYEDGALTIPNALDHLQDKYSKFGLRFSAMNDFLPNTPGEIRRRCEGLIVTIGLLAQAKIETLILFALQPESDDILSALERFYKAIVPRAEEDGVRIATHGHWCEGHAVWNRRTIERIIGFDPRPCNGICLCAGCFHQAGDDLPAMVREMPERIHAVHFRDTKLIGGCDLEEIPLGTGSVPISEILRALNEAGCNCPIIPEHLGSVRAQANMEITHAHAVGYLQGMLG